MGILFYRFISENLTSYINKEEQRTGNTNFDYTKISDKDSEFGRADTVKEKGFYILPSELFVNVCKKAKNDANRKKILNTFIERKNIDHFAKLITNADIADNDYNIAVSSYVEQENTTEVVDIEILNAQIAEIVIRQNKLPTAIDEIVADLEGDVK